MKLSKNDLFGITLIILFGLLAYFNSLKGEFILDDKALVEQNVYIKSTAHIPDIFSQDVGKGASCRYHFYRPLQLFSYLIDFSFWKLNVFGYHLTNVILNILAGLSIFWLALLLFNNRPVSLLTAILFTVHPAHSQVVSYISSRTDLLFAFFLLLSFIFYIKQLKQKNIYFYVIMVLAYIFSLLSKENALALPFVLLLYHFLFKEKINPKLFLSILGISFIYALLRLTLLRHILYIGSQQTNLFERLSGFFVAIYNYLKILILPFNLHMEYGNGVFGFSDYRAIIGFIIIVSLLAYAFKKRNSDKLISFSILWFFIGLIPVSNLYPLNAYMAENWIYLPSFGFCLVLSNYLILLSTKKNLKIFAGVLILFIILVYCLLIARQNEVWKDNISFYKNILKYNTSSSRAYNNLANVYLEQGNNQEALKLYKKALEIEPYLAASYLGLGNVYKNLGQLDEASRCYKIAISLKPNYEYAYNCLGLLYVSVGKLNEAAACFRKAIELNPNYKDARDNLKNQF